jgi:hypothetical protein
MTRNIISLTTIPPRMDGLGPTLASLLGQDAPIDRVILWIPERYRRSEFRDFALPSLPAGVEIGRCEHDYGPATKILPAVRAFAGQDVRILYCDDDRIYHRDWAAHLLSESDRFPADCLCEAGERIEVTALRAFSQSLRYRILAKLSLGIYGHFHRRRIRGFDPGHGPVDIAKGYGGVLVRPEFIPESAFDIPDRLWTVDDVWLSGQMALNGVTIRKVARREHSTKREVAEIAALIDFVHDGDGRDASNLACIRHFQEAHGIWLRQDDVGGGLTPADSRAGS